MSALRLRGFAVVVSGVLLVWGGLVMPGCESVGRTEAAPTPAASGPQAEPADALAGSDAERAVEKMRKERGSAAGDRPAAPARRSVVDQPRVGGRR
jgi:hypothetical protein